MSWSPVPYFDASLGVFRYYLDDSEENTIKKSCSHSKYYLMKTGAIATKVLASTSLPGISTAATWALSHRWEYTAACALIGMACIPALYLCGHLSLSYGSRHYRNFSRLVFTEKNNVGPDGRPYFRYELHPADRDLLIQKTSNV